MALYEVVAPLANRYRYLYGIKPRLPGLCFRLRVQPPDLAWSPVLTIALSIEVVELGAGCRAVLAPDAACLRTHAGRIQ